MRFRHFVRSAVLGAVIGLGVAVLPGTPALLTSTPAALAQMPAGPAGNDDASAAVVVAAEFAAAPGADNALAAGDRKPGRTNSEASDSSALAALAVIVLAVIVAGTAAVGARRSSSR